MNKRHPIDDLFKQQLGQSSADVPNDMWDRIAAERGQQNRKPKLLWLWSSVGVILIIAGILFASQSFNRSTESEDGLQKNTEQRANSLLESNQNQATALLQSTTIEDVNKSLSRTKMADDDHEHLQSANTNLSASKIIEKSNHRTKKIESLLSENRTTTSKTTKQSAQEELLLDDPISIEEQQLMDAESEALIDKESRISGPHQRVNQSVVKSIPSLSFDLSANEEVKLFEKSATSCARFNNPFFHLDLEVLLGPAYAHQQLSSRASESNVHLNQRLKSESANLSYSAGFRLAAISNTGLGLKSGLIYSQINDVFEHEVGSEMNISIVYGPNGEVLSMDTTFVGSYTEKHQNQLKFLEIPLLLGYETKVGKFRLGVNAGAYLQLVFDAKGQIFSPATDEPIAFGQIGDRNVLPIFNQRASAAWYAGASIAYNLHSRYSILAEPYFKTFPRALSAPEYDLKQNYWTVGLQLGLRMRL